MKEFDWDNFRQYCRDNIEDYTERINCAWNKIDKYRCPLSYADNELYNEMLDCLEDYCEEQDFDYDDMAMLLDEQF